ncbi:MAG TPA: thiamine-phosphate kinase [Methylibium sp.]|uniref:thiamine-phosphate kinase n=1 Tax=Methylibium sp. TaxID=2067992 RepID=UPI002DBC4C7F|nr:thiamine-phosphate kinase [Methylibium sp.]HEU4460402.1 thiamine-phosphate kinase [Methylibium sp.]
MGEFELIARHFARPTQRAVVGPGDDCAVIAPRAGHRLAVSCDMLVEGRHFLPTVDARRLGHKALAVNLSDLAACGAEPLACTLALALPRPDAAWLEAFAGGLHALAERHGCELVGGDTTCGPLNLCITVFGEVGDGRAAPGAILRSGARAGDDLWVSHAPQGGLGDARLALEVFRGTVALEGTAFERVRRAMECPEPRVALGVALRGLAGAAIDVSDGLTGDLGHLLRASAVGATLEADALPRSAELAAQPLALQRLCTLAGGDDYELVFTVPAGRRAEVEAAAAQAGCAVRRVGRIEAEPGLRIVDQAGGPLEGAWPSFDHFA